MTKPVHGGVHSGTIAFAGALLATVAVVGCAMNPATGERDLVLMTEGQEIGMG